MIEFRLPSLGSDMDEGKLLAWQVKPGDTVKKGQVVAVVDTAKAAIDVECWQDGVVHRLITEPGETIAVGTSMAVLRAPGEDEAAVEKQWAALKAAPKAQAAAAPVGQASAAPAPASSAPAAPSPPMALAPVAGVAPVPGGGRQRVSPAARRRAQELGIDRAALAAIAGSGAEGAVTLNDVEAAARQVAAADTPAKLQTTPTGAAAPATTSPPQTALAPAPTTRSQQMRQVIAAAMSRSKREIPHYYLADNIVFERAAAWLAARNEGLAPTQRLLPAALLLKSVAIALKRYPEFNGFYQADRFVPGSGIHLGVAISLRQGGLVAPALRDADSMDVATLTRALLDLVRRTRAGSLRSSELSDATITVTNLGEQSIDSVFGVIYPPQVALVGFGRIAARAWAFDGSVRAAPVLTATLAGDHRASDGHRGALLLAKIGEQLQAPEALDKP